MPYTAETIDWLPAAAEAGIAIAGATDLVNIGELSLTRQVQLAAGIRAATITPINRGNQAGRRVFRVTYAPAASASAARLAIEALEDALRAFVPTAPVLVWKYGTKIHTYSDAALESASFEQRGLTVFGQFTFSYSTKATTDVP